MVPAAIPTEERELVEGGGLARTGGVITSAGLILAGLILTTFYFSLIAAAVRHQEGGLGSFFHQLLVSLLRLVILSVVFVALLLVIWLPLLPVAPARALPKIARFARRWG